MNWSMDIIEKIAKRKAILFLGAGISANAVSLDGKSILRIGNSLCG